MPETNTTSLLELARQGDPKAIAHLLNRALHPQGISTKVTCQQGILTVFADAAEAPEPSSLVGVIRKGIRDLHLDAVTSIKIYGRKIGETTTGWREEVILKNDTVRTKSVSTQKPQTDQTLAQLINQLRSVLRQGLQQVKSIRIGKRTVIAIVSFVCLVLLAMGGVVGFNWWQLRTAQNKTIQQAQALLGEATQTQSSTLDALKTNTQKLNEAIVLLKGIENSPGSLYDQAQSELKQARNRLQEVEQRVEAETSIAQSLTATDQLAKDAVALSANSPYPLETWRQAQTKLDQAIQQLEALPQETTAATEIKTKLATYRRKSDDLKKGLATEEKATKVLQAAIEQAKSAMAATEEKTEYTLAELQQAQRLWWKASAALKLVPKQSAAYQQVLESAPIYIENYKEVSDKVKEMQQCLKGSSSICGYVYLSLKEPPTYQTSSSSEEQSVDRDPFSSSSY